MFALNRFYAEKCVEIVTVGWKKTSTRIDELRFYRADGEDSLDPGCRHRRAGGKRYWITSSTILLNGARY